MLEQEERERMQTEMDNAMCEIKLFCQHPTHQHLVEKMLKVHKDCTLQDATQTAHTILGLEDIVPLDCCRLVKYEEFSDSLECSYGGREQEKMENLLGGARANYNFELFLEIRKQEEMFQEYKPGGITVKVHEVNLEEEVSVHPYTIRCYPSNTVEELYSQIAQVLGITGSRLRVVLDTYTNDFKLLEVSRNTLYNEGFKKSNKVFVEFKDSADADLPYKESKLWRVMDCYAHTICVHINIPKVDDVNLVNLDCLRLQDDASGENKCELPSEENADKNTDTVDANVIKEQPDSSLPVASGITDQDFDKDLEGIEIGDSSISQAPPGDPCESSSHTDVERTLVSDELSSSNNIPVDGVPSPRLDVTHPESDSLLSGEGSSSPMEGGGRTLGIQKFFKAWPYTDFETGDKMLRVKVDKRITLTELKKELESHIGMKANSFKIFRVYSNNQEFECTRLSDKLMYYGEDSTMAVKLNQTLPKKDYKVKVYRLSINNPEPFKFLMDWVLVRGMTVLNAKKQILPQIKEMWGLDVLLNRCRLRKKTKRTPSSLLYDHQCFEKDIPINIYWDMFIEILPEFVGLVNLSMTYYLNSLLQTLFMTPEFRNALYRWEFNGTDENGTEEDRTKSIPFQLQKLFLHLQTSPNPAIGTADFTTSFGWNSNITWQQHEVQELCRAMFNAVEQKFENTQQANLISRLYEGRLKDYIKCLECGNECTREATFLDVPLIVRPFGSNQAYTSLIEALHAFVAPETLNGDNQYHCEVCGKKCDAHKGVKFMHFPYLLTLQMKRFDYDPATMHRIKINDKISFPEILTLNEFIHSEEADAREEEPAAAIDDDCEGINVETEDDLCLNEKNLKIALQQGPYVYELFSIMVHSGSADGGHYYAYIKSFKTKQWYCFNDAEVTKVTQEDIQKIYGGDPTRKYYSSAYSSSTNAYMLVYRQIDKQKNADFMSLEDLPEHTNAILQGMLQKEERERFKLEMDRALCKVKLLCRHPTHQRLIKRKLEVHKDCTLHEATIIAHRMLRLEDIVPVDCCRLVKYDEFSDSLECSYGGREQEKMGDLLGGVRADYRFELFLEVRKQEETFQEYKPGSRTVKMHVVNQEEETNPFHCSNTAGELHSQVNQELQVGNYAANQTAGASTSFGMGFGTTTQLPGLFGGITIASTSAFPFGGTIQSTPTFGTTGGFPATQATSGFPATQATSGFPATQATSGFPAIQATSGFPATQATSGFPAFQATSGFPATQATSGFPAFQATSGTTTRFNPRTGTDTIVKGGVPTNIVTIHLCITCMKEYENKSLEELRIEDYIANRNAGASSPVGMGFGTAGFSFGGTTQSTPMFGGIPATQATISTTVKFCPLLGTDTMLKGGVSTFIRTRLQCVTCMNEYENKSFEELRVEDYTAGRKGGMGSSVGMGFGIATQEPCPIVVAADASTSATSFGETAQPTPMFGTTGASSEFPATPAISGTIVEYNPQPGTDTIVKGGVSTDIITIHQCITSMTEYENKSLEELRMEDYVADRKSGVGSAIGRGFTTIAQQPGKAKAKRETPDKMLCKICMDEELGVVFLPCGHLTTCLRCAQLISNCPLCRKLITERVKTYLS